MRKIECIFQRRYFDTYGTMIDEKDKTRASKYLAIDEINPNCQWVFDDPARSAATIKWDGTAVMIRKIPGETFVYQRLQTPTMCNPADPDAIHVQDLHHKKKSIWWIPSNDRWILDAFKNSGGFNLPEGTYEAIGPKINGNRQMLREHILRKHGDIVVAESLFNEPLWLRTFEGIKTYFKDFGSADGYFYEGLVFHHHDGRMAKITRSAMGY